MFDYKKVGLYLDFGHGGSDPGSTLYDKTKESDYNLKIGMKIKALLSPYFKTIHTTRSTNETVSLSARTSKMNNLTDNYEHLDVYSFHTNAYNKIANGVEICLGINNSTDTIWTEQFLKEYSSKFGIGIRGLTRRKNEEGLDYYWIIKASNNKCKVKIIEFGFGDNKKDFDILKSKIDDIALFTAQKIAGRYGITIEPINDIKDWQDIIKEVSQYDDVWISFVKKNHSPTLNLKGLIEKLYWTMPKK